MRRCYGLTVTTSASTSTTQPPYHLHACIAQSAMSLKVVLATFLSAMAAIAANQSSGQERSLPSTQPSPHTVAHCARLRICVSNPRWTGEVVRLATIA